MARISIYIIAYNVEAFLRHYVVRLGFLDGRAGFVIAFSNFEGTFLSLRQVHRAHGVVDARAGAADQPQAVMEPVSESPMGSRCYENRADAGRPCRFR